MGTTGEYSDRSEWMAKAFKTAEKAEEHIKILDIKMQEFGAVRGYIAWKELQAISAKMNEYDPKFIMDYTGTSYYYEEVELED